MKIIGLHIYGYGIFKDFRLLPDRLAGSPLLIYGPNEAGKSTLMSFIRGVLFGFKNEGSKPVPIQGGRRGGYLLLKNAAGDILRVERTGRQDGRVVVVLPDGAQRDEKFLSTDLLRGVSPVLYRNIFAIGMDELRRLGDLKKDEVSTHIYGAGTGVSPGKLTQATNYLYTRARDLFNPRGRVQEVNKLIKKVRDIDQGIKRLEQEPAGYWELKDELAELEREYAGLESKRRSLKKRKNQLHDLVKARVLWVKKKNLKEQLSKLNPVDDFPPGGISRLEKLLERRNHRRVTLHQCEFEVQDVQSRLASMVLDTRLLKCGPAINELDDQRALYLEKIQKYREDETRVKHCGEEVQDRLADLGPGWNEEKVLSLDLSIPVYHQAESYGELFRTQGEEIKNITRNAESRQREIERFQQKIGEINSRVLEIPVCDHAHLIQECSVEERWALMETLYINLHALQAMETKLEGEQKRKQDLMARKDFAASSLAAAEGSVQLGWLVWALTAAGMAGIFLLWAGFNAAGIILFGVGMGLAFLFKKISAKIETETKNRQSRLRSEIDALEQTLNGVDDAIAGLHVDLEKLRKKIGLAASKVKGSRDIELRDLPAIRRQLEYERESEALEGRLIEKKIKLDDIKRNKNDQVKKNEDLKKEWARWLENKNLPAMEPAGVLSFLRLAEKARDAISRLKISRGELRQTADFTSNYLKMVNELAVELNIDSSKKENINGFVTNLYALWKDEEEKQRLQHQLQVRLNKARDGHTLAQTAFNEVEFALSELMALGQAENEEDFRNRAVVFERRQELRHDLEGCEEQLLLIAGSVQDLNELCFELEQGTRHDNLQELEYVERQINETDAGLKRINASLAEKKLHIQRLENDDQLARCRQEKDMLYTQIAAKTREWRVFTLCAALLNMAKEKYERDRQPGVLLQAGRYLKPMTGGRYVKVISPVGAPDQLEVERLDGERVALAHLSRGAAGQLYLSLRLALAKHYCDSVVSLPLMLDDIMVDFDYERLAGAMLVLQAVAAQNQVLYFTCHRHVRDLMEQLIPEYKWLQLDA